MPLLKNLKQHKMLLDTHVWLWAMTGNSTLSEGFIHSFENSLKMQGVLISPMSIWEIGMLIEKKRIELEMDTLDWINRALNTSGIQLCAINPHEQFKVVDCLENFMGIL